MNHFIKEIEAGNLTACTQSAFRNMKMPLQSMQNFPNTSDKMKTPSAQMSHIFSKVEMFTTKKKASR